MVEQKLDHDRHLRNVSNMGDRRREDIIKRIQVSYGYDRDNAEKVWEMMRVKNVEKAFGAGCGALAVYKWMPIHREWEASNAILRKSWMRAPILATIFGATYYCATQLPQRFFQKLSNRRVGQTPEAYKGQGDLVGRFRLFENDSGATDSAEDQLLDHLAMYDKDPMSKPELLNQMVKRISEKEDLSKIFRIKRQGKDTDDIFWNFGKVHGLENIAYCSAEDIEATGGSPMLLQKLVNKVTPDDIPGCSSY